MSDSSRVLCYLILLRKKCSFRRHQRGIRATFRLEASENSPEIHHASFSLSLWVSSRGIPVSLTCGGAHSRHSSVRAGARARARTHDAVGSTLAYADAIDARDGRDDCVMDGSG